MLHCATAVNAAFDEFIQHDPAKERGAPALGKAQSLQQDISGDLWLILRECLERKSDGGLALDAI